MRIVFTGGGTGGHVLPNMAVAQACASKFTPSTFSPTYIGQKGGIEETIASRYNIPFYGIQAGKMRRYVDVKNVVDALRVPVGFTQALFILRRLRPGLVFAKGGYVSVPVVFAARTLGIPVWLHESDATPGLSNGICARFAERIFVAFEEAATHFGGRRAEVVGNPVREEILQGDPQKGYAMTGLEKGRPILLILGGSLGALALNKKIVDWLPKLTHHMQIIHVTGEGKNLSAQTPHYRVFEFLNKELAHAYAIADCVLSRAGSGTIFETLAWNKPMLLVPLPSAGSRGDQIENAAVSKTRGWAEVCTQEELSAEGIVKFVTQTQELQRIQETQREDGGVDFAIGSTAKIALEIKKCSSFDIK